MNVIDINLDEFILTAFRDVFIDIVQCEADEIILKGGRSSTKSMTVAHAIIVGCTTHKSSAVALVKYGNRIEDRLVNTFRECIGLLGLEDMWKLRRSPFEYVLLDRFGMETDVSIKFTGCDDAAKLRSYKPRRGNFRYIWFEELTDFKSLREYNDLKETFTRGGEQTVISTYNPPRRASNWVNKEYNVQVGKVLGYKDNYVKEEFNINRFGISDSRIRIVHHSTYLDVIKDGKMHWLGKNFIGMAEQSRVENNKYYRHAYLGEVVGTDANIFSNIVDWDGNTTRLDIKTLYRGLDWGYGGKGLSAYVEWYFDFKNRRLYAINEFGSPGIDPKDMAYEIRLRNKHNFPVKADNAMPIMNRMARNAGANIIGVKKRPDSVRAGIKWLQSLNGIYISKRLTPKIYKEFTEYEYIVDREGNVTNELPKENDHFVDATRYALDELIKNL